MKSVVSEKGQVTIPKPLREKLGLHPGVVLDFAAERGTLVARKAVGAADPVDAVTGILPPMDVDAEIREDARESPDSSERQAPCAPPLTLAEC